MNLMWLEEKLKQRHTLCSHEMWTSLVDLPLKGDFPVMRTSWYECRLWTRKWKKFRKGYSTISESACSCWITFWSPSFDIWRWYTYREIQHLQYWFERRADEKTNASRIYCTKPFLQWFQYIKIYRYRLSSSDHPSRPLRQPERIKYLFEYIPTW